ncbi:MAG: HD domain-containing protein [Lachnospiraceae bacterium]|jgi:metal-dependent HD superfamily phosphatase/phosphodiesterase
MKADEIIKDKLVRAYYKKGNEILGYLGFTDHSIAHAEIVSRQAVNILKTLGYDEQTQLDAKIAGQLHDIGNAISRSHHAEYGALLARDLLMKTDLSVEDQVTIISAIANHDESTGTAYDPVSAALILADKTDVRRSRVRTKDPANFDIHDRVNYAVTGANLVIEPANKRITLNLQIDESIISMFDYFEIFLNRMLMCRRAAGVFGMKFRLKANGQKVS